MNDEAGFLAAIQSNGDDDTVRLVYADWLDERNDPRGEYLRLDVEIRRHIRENIAVSHTLRGPHLERECKIDGEWVALVNRVPYNKSSFVYPWFWRLLESADRSLRTLCQSLEAFTEEQLLFYHGEFEGAKCSVNPCSWEECRPYLQRGCSEDHGDDFAAWVVMEGREFHEQIRTRPEQIDQHLQMYEDAEHDRRRKRKRRGSTRLWDIEVDNPEYRGFQRADYIANAICLARFGHELRL